MKEKKGKKPRFGGVTQSFGLGMRKGWEACDPRGCGTDARNERIRLRDLEGTRSGLKVDAQKT